MKIVYGRSGCGKSHYIMNKIKPNTDCIQSLVFKTICEVKFWNKLPSHCIAPVTTP